MALVSSACGNPSRTHLPPPPSEPLSASAECTASRLSPRPRQVLEAEKTLADLIAPDKTIKADAEERVRQAVDERAIAQAKSLKAHFDAFAQRLGQLQDAERQKQTEALVAAKLQQAEAAGEAGNVDEAQRLMQEAEQLKASARSAPAGKAADPQTGGDQKLRCCDICSAYLSIYDNERRLARSRHSTQLSALLSVSSIPLQREWRRA